MSERKLGKGLSALIGDNNIIDEIRKQEEVFNKSKDTSLGDSKNPKISMIKVSLINPDPEQKQPRRTFHESTIDELASSIKEKGVLQPIFIRKREGDSAGFYIISGERRWRAAKKVNLDTIPAIILEAKDKEAWEIGIIENLQREDLNSIDEAYAFNFLMEKYGYSKDMLAKKLSKSLAYISNALNLINLSKKVKNLIKEDFITQGHARPLLRLEKDDADKVVDHIIKEGISVRETEALIRDILTGKILVEALGNKEVEKEGINYTNPINKLQNELSDDFKSIENDISEYLDTKVALKFSKRTKKPSGKIEIKFKDIDNLQDILRTIGVCSK
ncbi:MAG: ParB/RepB/Spo0J family partition protein [Alphaproteobacteria bacterium]|jgi:ParB family chromosome partitioning protein|nr:ParB/RepB/Spo0J family partition protein [Alphaproteobacteria bacterium]